MAFNNHTVDVMNDYINKLVEKQINEFRDRHDEELYPDTVGDLTKISINWNKKESNYQDNYLDKKYSKKYPKEESTDVEIELPKTLGDKLKYNMNIKYNKYIDDMIEEISKTIQFKFNNEMKDVSIKTVSIIISEDDYSKYLSYNVANLSTYGKEEKIKEFNNFLFNNFNLIYIKLLKLGFYIRKCRYSFMYDVTRPYNGDIEVRLNPTLKDKINIFILKRKGQW